MKIQTMIAVPVLLLAFSAAATTAELAAVADLSGRTGADYAQARTTLIGTIDADALRVTVEGLQWKRTTWRTDCVTEALLLHHANPGVADPLSQLAGLDPAVYLRLRRPEPVAGRELIAANVPVSILIERYLKTFDVEPIHASPYPAGTIADRVEQLRTAERAALRAAILRAVGEANHPAAHHFLFAIARDDAGSLAARRIAAISLGQTNSARTPTLLRQLITNGNSTVAAAAVIGAGQLRSAAGYELLAAAATAPKNRDAQRAAIIGLAGFANGLTWGGVNDPRAAELRQAAALHLVEIVRRPDAVALGESLVQALAAAKHPTVTQNLQVIANDVAQPETARSIAYRSLQLIEIAASRQR